MNLAKFKPMVPFWSVSREGLSFCQAVLIERVGVKCLLGPKRPRYHGRVATSPQYTPDKLCGVFKTELEALAQIEKIKTFQAETRAVLQPFRTALQDAETARWQKHKDCFPSLAQIIDADTHGDGGV